MKYLNDYIDSAISSILKENGAFFAFSNKQYKNKKVEGTTYINLGGGLIAPKKNAKILLEQFDLAMQNGIVQDVEENGVKNIIWRELANYECQIVNNCRDVIEALKEYPISENDILNEFKAYMQHCIEHDLF